MLTTNLSLIQLSSFKQISFESKKIFIDKDSILTALCRCKSLLRVLNKECKHTHDLTWMWIALDLCCINCSPTPLIMSLCTLSHRPSWWSCDLEQPLYNWKCKRGGLIKVSCPRVLVVLDHPVAVENPCWTIFQKVYSDLLNFCAWVEPWVA